MEKLDITAGSSEDVIEKNLETLKQVFPDAFTEGKIDFDVLRQLLGDSVDDKEEKYGLNWHGKRRARQIALTPSTGTLRPCPDESVDWETTQNLFIEGDNLEALKLLQKSYAGKVKMIYIDPPYNTGNDFVYKDDYRDNIKNYLDTTGQTEGGTKITTNSESSGRYHTDWLNMMYPRLKLAKNLLKKDGVIFISIDDNEVHNLKEICYDIFGEENYVATLMWRRRKTQANLSKNISPVHDYILCFAINIDTLKLNKLPYSKEFVEKTFSNPDNDPKGNYQTGPLARPENSSNSAYELELPNGRKITAKWSCSPETYNKYLTENRLYIPKDGDGMPRIKIYLSELEGMLPNTWLDNIATNEEGSREIEFFFGTIAFFSSPKPTKLIKHLLILGCSNSDLILDFFAGSATTAHSIMKLNSEDGGNRRYIMVQLPEPTDENSEAYKAGFKTITDIAKERIHRAGEKIREDNPLFKGDTGFRVFKLDSSNVKAWDPDTKDIEESIFDSIEHIKEERSENDVLYELLLKLGLDLSVPIEERVIAGLSVHSIGAGVLFVCLSKDIIKENIEPLANGLVNWHKVLAPETEPTIVFRDSAFDDDVAKTNLTAILRQHGLDNIRSL